MKRVFVVGLLRLVTNICSRFIRGNTRICSAKEGIWNKPVWKLPACLFCGKLLSFIKPALRLIIRFLFLCFTEDVLKFFVSFCVHTSTYTLNCYFLNKTSMFFNIFWRFADDSPNIKEKKIKKRAEIVQVTIFLSLL